MSAPTAPPPARPHALRGWLLGALVAAVLVWAIWPTLATFARIWATNPQYSHGFLVGPFSLFLLWHRRALCVPDRRDGAWLGVVLLLIGCALKLIGGLYSFAWPDRISVLFLIAGAAGTVGGRSALRWSWPAIAYLIFLVPMPGRAETLLSGPLQKFATIVSANVLQTFGFFAQPDGTLLILSEADLGIVEACSGLRMMLTFVALSTAVAIVLERPTWQRVAVICGAIPVALACNVTRIVVTAVVLETAGRKWADLVFHDLAGWLMMPMGLVLLWLELAFLNRIVVLPPGSGNSGRVVSSQKK